MKPVSPLSGWRGVWLSRGALLLILLLGASLRCMSLLSWDGGTGQHPDERFFADVTSVIRLPASTNAYFDSARSPANPRNVGKEYFTYGTVPPLLTRLVAVMLTSKTHFPETVPASATDPDPPHVPSAAPVSEMVPNPERTFPRFPEAVRKLFNPLEENLTTYHEVFRVGRALSVLFDLGSILLVYLTAVRLYSRRVGLLAALFSALAVFHIQQSHFFQDPTFSTFFTVLALYWGVRAAQGGGAISFTLLGLAIGAAAANRITLATLGVVGIAAAFLTVLAHRHTLLHRHAASPGTTAQPVPSLAGLLLGRGLPLLFLAGGCTLLSFRIFQPYAFIGSTPTSPPVPSSFPAVESNPLHTMHTWDFLEGWGFFDVRLDPRYIENMERIKEYTTGERDWPPAFQWAQRTPYLFPLENFVLWGVGPFLGVAAWLGWIAAGLWVLRRLLRGRPPPPADEHDPTANPLYPRTLAAMVLWVWVAFYFGWMGGQFTLYLRYMLPISGALIIFAAWLLAGQHHLPEWGTRLRRWAPAFGRWSLIVVVLGTAAWAYAFTRIYTREHSRILAARWVQQHVPPGSTITHESWDDPLPLGAAGSNTYDDLTTHLYAEDEPIKYFGHEGVGDGLLDHLEQADYIALTSNRVYDSVIRQPARHPASIRYYHYLFNGELGYKLVADITSYPTIMGIAIPDQSAEEAFTVYDHPRVLIFRKQASFSREHARELLTAGINWEEVYRVPSLTVHNAPNALRLTEEEWPTYHEGGTWSERFNPRSIVNRKWAAPLVWLLALEALGLAAFALLFRALPWLPDRGWTLARPLGMLAVAYGAWLLGSFKLLPFAPLSAWVCAGALLAAGAWAGWSSRAKLRTFWRERRAALITAEALFLLAFAAALLVRWLNPDLWHPSRGGEKPMEFAYLNAILQSAAFPPYDPWFAGGHINYYYFGFVIVGALIHMTTIVPAIAFNLAVPTLFALAAVGAWGVVYNLLAPAPGGDRRGPTLLASEQRARISALLAPIFALLLGNLAQPLWYLNGYAAEQTHRPEWVFWDATRIVEHTVNEFPFFTFLFADMHPHMIVIPFSLAVLGLAVALVRMSGARQPAAPGQRGVFVFAHRSFVVILLLLGLLAGALRATNTWDYPTYVGLALVALGLAHLQAFRREQRTGKQQPQQEGKTDSVAFVVARYLLSFLLATVLVVGVGSLLFAPFSSSFATQSTSIKLLPGDMVRTTVGEILRLHGLWLFLSFSAGVAAARRWLRLSAWGIGAVVGGAGTLLALIAALEGSGPQESSLSAVWLLLPLLAGALVLLWYLHRLPPRLVLPAWWAVGALAILVGVELVVVQGDVGRMNTVFKFGIHAWILFALATAVALPWMWRSARRQVNGWGAPLLAGFKWGWRGAVVVLVGAALVYPITATPGRIADRYADDLPHTLDGTAFLDHVALHVEGHPPLREDAEAIAWLQQHTHGTPIILEAHQPSYHWAGRVATFSGLPTLLGWEWHQVQQRMATRAEQVIHARKDAIATIYNSPDPQRARELIDSYGIEYVYVGGVERAIYEPTGLAKFDTLVEEGHLTPAFSTGATTIYRVNNPGNPASILTTSMRFTKPELDMPPPLLLKTPVNELPAVDAFAWNGWTNDTTATPGPSWRALLLWVVAFYALALVGLPLAMLVFGRWHNTGTVWARIVGLLAVGYATWLPASLGIWHYSRWSITGGVLLVLALDIAAIRTMGGTGAFVGRLRHGVRHLVASEALFLIGLAFFATLRALNPDLWHPVWGGEKPMESGFLNAILRSPVMPPYDPFFSDGYINYYYYGLYLVSLPIKATGINPAIAFNLVIATLFALTLIGGYGVVAQLTGRVRYGLVGAAFVALLGNLASWFKAGWSSGIDPVSDILFGASPTSESFFDRLSSLGARLGDWYIGPSRVIIKPAFTINEFPFWSFLYADLHPHMIALPITLLMIAAGYQLFRAEWSRETSGAGDPPRSVLYLFVALALGALAVTNSWDFPTYGLLTAAVLAGAVWHREQRLGPLARGMARAVVLALALGVGSMLLYAPFFDHYHAFVSGVGLVRDGTPLRHYLLLYGLFAAVLLPAIIGGAWRLLRWAGAPRRRLRIEAQNVSDTHPDPALPPSPALKRIALATTGYIAVGKVLAQRRVPILSPLAGLASHLVFLGGLLPALPGAARHVWTIWQQDRRPWVPASVLAEPQQPATALLPPSPSTANTDTPDEPREPVALRVRASSRSSCLGQIVSINGRFFLLLALAGLLLITWQQQVMGLRFWLGALIVVGAGLLLARRPAPATWYTFLLATLGWAVSLGIEFLFIRDHLAGGEHYRMNTVFKFGYQIWTLLALAAAASLPLVLRELHRLGRAITRRVFPIAPGTHPGTDKVNSPGIEVDAQEKQRRRRHLGGLIAQGVGLSLLAPLIAIALLFVLVGTPSRLANRFDISPPGPTLDGLAFMDYATFTHEGQRVNLRPDGEAIAWINQHIVGTPVLAQSGLWFYRTYGIRVAANTGLPTIVSALHENEQRDPGIVGIRDSDVERLFRTPDPAIAEQILRKYHVNYVYVGSVEHAFYPEEGIRKFEAMRGTVLNLIYYTPGVQIYRVLGTPYRYPEPEPFFDTPDGKPPEVVVPPPAPPGQEEVHQLDLHTLEDLVAADPTDNITAIELARRYAQAGRHHEGVEVLKEASRYHPNDIYLHHVWGDMLAHLGRYDEAEEVYRYAATTRPNSFNWYKLGSELLSWERFEDAENALIKALTLEPVEPATYYTLGLLYKQQGKTSQATKHMQLYLDLAPEGLFRTEAQKFLNQEKDTNGNNGN